MISLIARFTCCLSLLLVLLCSTSAFAQPPQQSQEPISNVLAEIAEDEIQLFPLPDINEVFEQPKRAVYLPTQPLLPLAGEQPRPLHPRLDYPVRLASLEEPVGQPLHHSDGDEPESKSDEAGDLSTWQPTPGESVSLEVLTRLKSEIQEASEDAKQADIDEAEKQARLEAYNKAIQLNDKSAELESQRLKYLREIDAAPTTIQSIEAALEKTIGPNSNATGAVGRSVGS